jgi:tritrans,polycis-undecaprenyl-diphosphate synthase [geranylgeranyl-diphosphate specific]
MSVRDRIYGAYGRLLSAEVSKQKMPNHVAIIMDGNRRYAEKIGMPRHMGHLYGVETTENVLYWCKELGIRHLTIYAFSTENFERGEDEKQFLFTLMKDKIKKVCEDGEILEKGLRVKVIGNLDALPEDVREEARKMEQMTEKCNDYFLYVALAYGGRQEIVDTLRSIGQLVKDGSIKAGDVDDKLISSHLYAGDAAAVDMIIRTGGEMRTSNFLPWQASGNESAAYFCAPYWPEFRKIDFLRAIRTYQMRGGAKKRNALWRGAKLFVEFVKKGGER